MPDLRNRNIFEKLNGAPQFLFAISLIILSRLITFIAFPKASLLPDSGSYAPPSFFDFSLVSFSGHAMRGWPTPLLFSLLPNDSMRIFALLVISGCAWIFFAKTIMGIICTTSRKWIVLVLLLSISCSPNLLQWDTSILGQSLLNSTYVIVASFLIRFFRNPKNSSVVLGLVSFTILLYLQKSSNILTLLAVILVILFKRNQLQGRKFKIGLSIFILIGTIYGTAVSVSVDNFWKGGTYSGKALLWHLGGQSPAASDFREYLSKNTKAPSCIYEKAPYSNIDTEMAKIFESCKGVDIYLAQRFKTDFIRFLLSSPKDIFKLESIGFGATFTGSSSNYGSAVGLIPAPVYQLTQGGVTPDFRFSKSQDQVQAFNVLKNGEPIWIFAPGVLWVTFCMGIFIYRSRRRILDDNDKAIFSIVLLLILQSALTFLVIPSEWVRSTASYVPLLTLISSIYVVIQIPNLIQFKKELH